MVFQCRMGRTSPSGPMWSGPSVWLLRLPPKVGRCVTRRGRGSLRSYRTTCTPCHVRWQRSNCSLFFPCWNSALDRPRIWTGAGRTPILSRSYSANCQKRHWRRSLDIGTFSWGASDADSEEQEFDMRLKSHCVKRVLGPKTVVCPKSGERMANVWQARWFALSVHSAGSGDT